jgi:hypothetical protein
LKYKVNCFFAIRQIHFRFFNRTFLNCPVLGGNKSGLSVWDFLFLFLIQPLLNE